MAIKKSRGFTIVELMMTVTIMGILFGTIPLLMINMTQLQRQSEARLGIQRDARIGLDLINRFTREAIASTVVVDRFDTQPFYSRISYTTIESRTFSFYQEGKHLNMVADGSTKTISENLLYLAFTYPESSDDNIISVSMTTEKATYEGGVKNLQLSVEKVRIMND